MAGLAETGMTRGRDDRGAVVVVALVVTTAVQLTPLRGAVATTAFVVATILATAAAGLLLRRLPVRGGHLLVLVGAAVVVEVALLGLEVAAGAVLVWQDLVRLAGWLVAAVVATRGRVDPAAVVGPTTSVVVGGAAIVTLASWWLLGAGGTAVPAATGPAWVVLGLGGAALTGALWPAVRHAALMALLADPVAVLLAPVLGAFTEFLAAVAVWLVGLAMVVLLLALDGRRQSLETVSAER